MPACRGVERTDAVLYGQVAAAAVNLGSRIRRRVAREEGGAAGEGRGY
jgi:hypothetical protein